MKKLATLIGVVAIVAFGLAQGTGGISGTITNVTTGKPIVGAFVGISHDFGSRPDSGQMPPPRGGQRPPPGDNGRTKGDRNQQPGVRSDSIGFYEFTGLQPGKYIVQAWAMGFEPATYPETVTVDSGAIVSGIDFALKADTTLGAISGFVTDAVTQLPLAGAFVCAWHSMVPDSCHRPPKPDSSRMPPPGDSGRLLPPPPGDSGHGHIGCPGPMPNGDSTDGLGAYTISYLHPGKYVVGARCTGYSPSIYPETVVVVAGQTTSGIDFALQPTDSTTKPTGSVSTAGISTSGSSSVPAIAIVPNPFRGHTTVLLSMPNAASITLRVYDASGKLVNDVARGYFESGSYSIGIDAARMARGVYLVKLGTGSKELSQKLVIR
ncbi:MAG TPA: carboxypeptidase regulatory-like domain-containing protein [bacterium]|nr:carboxypeptidase regulatory-like domain-containing protein [bacterium]